MELVKHTHTVYIESDGERQAGRDGGREGGMERAMEDGGWEGGSKGCWVGREGARGGSDESMM